MILKEYFTKSGKKRILVQNRDGSTTLFTVVKITKGGSK